MRAFIAFICRLPDTRFCALFPDLPGCTSTGDSIAEALHNAQDELAIYCRELREMGAPIPPPSYIHELGPDQPDGLIALIRAPEDARNASRFIQPA